MSFVPKEERPKLKAKRFSKFESSVISVADTLNDTGQGLKRKIEDSLQGAPQPKRKYSEIVTQSQSTKNLANNRLQKLKNFLKADLNHENSTSENECQKSNFKIPLLKLNSITNNIPDGFRHEESNTEQMIPIPKTSKNIYENLSEWASPPIEPLNKNISHEFNGKLQAVFSPSNQEKHTPILERQDSGFCSFQGARKYENRSCEKPVHSDYINRTEKISSLHKPDGNGKSQRHVFRSTQENDNIHGKHHKWTSADLRETCDYNRNTQTRFSHTNQNQTEQTRSTTEDSGNSIYRNINKWASPPDIATPKNFASSRLQRLKNVVKDLKPKVKDPAPNCTPEKICTATNSEQIHCSPLLRDNCVTSKRDITDDDISPKCTSSNKMVINPFSSGFNSHQGESLLKNCVEAPSHLPERISKERNVCAPKLNELSADLQLKGDKGRNISSLSTNLNRSMANASSRALQIRKNLMGMNTSLNAVDQTYEDSGIKSVDKGVIDRTEEAHYQRKYREQKPNSSTPVSRRLNLNRNKLANSNNTFTYESNIELLRPEDIRPTQSCMPLAENSDNYNGKMERTASWIMNCQNSNVTQSTSELKQKSDDNKTQSENNTREVLEDDSMDMEWTNAEPDSEIVPDQNVEEADKNDVKQPEVPSQPEKSRNLCIVVDTNVFISGLSKIKDIMTMKISGPIQPILYIPWMVITELDFMKHDCSDDKLKQKVTNSIKYINVVLKENNPRFIGQTVYEMEKQRLIGKSPDDKIISCCLQVAEKYETVILLSNDLNLKSKAMINGITACSANEIVMKIVSKVTKNTKAQKIMQKMSVLCSSVICECAKETYGYVWSKMDMLSNPPWSLHDCLKRFKKYWGTVFKEKLMKQFTKAVEDLLELFNENKYFGDDSKDYVRFVKLCINICIFLKDVEEFRGSVENTLTDITKLG